MENFVISPPPNVIDLLLDTVFLVDAHGRIVYVSAACERMFGYVADEMIGQSMIDFVLPEDRARTIEESRQVIAGIPRIGFENRYRRKDGHPVHVMWSARWSKADKLRVGVARDVTDQKHVNGMQEVAYAVSEAAHNGTDLPVLLETLHQIVASLVPMAAFAVAIRDSFGIQATFAYTRDAGGNTPALPETLVRHYCVGPTHGNLPVQEPLPFRHNEATNAETPPGNAVDSWLAIPLTTQQETIGALFIMPCADRTCSDRDRELLKFVSGQVSLAIERKRLKDELVHAAQYDELTGLANRRPFHQQINSALARCRRKERCMALIFLDLDGFKQVNDSFGHAVGDVLLKEVARRLTMCVRKEDMVARMGGDEFVVLLEDIEKSEDALGIANKIRGVVNVPLLVDGLVLQPRASMGIAVYPEDGSASEQLLKHADNAMYQEKQANLSAKV